MVLYKKKNNDLAAIDNALDRLLLLFAFNYPFVAFIAQDPEAMVRVPAAFAVVESMGSQKSCSPEQLSSRSPGWADNYNAR